MMQEKKKLWLTGAQLRAARALLGITAEELANETMVGLRTIRRAEKTNGPVPITAANAQAIIRVLEAKGVAFLTSSKAGSCTGLNLNT